MNKSRGFFAHVLVDIDFLFDLPNQIMVERLRFAFIIDVECKILPLYYSNCKMIGHDLSNCRKLYHNANTNVVGGKQLVLVKRSSNFIVLRSLVFWMVYKTQILCWRSLW